MLAGMISDKSEQAYVAAEEYVETLSTSGETYSRIKSLLRARPRKMIQLDGLSHELKKLVQFSQVTEDNVYLDEITKVLLDELFLEWDNKELFREHNLPVRNKILLHGATGNGKTTIARHIAKISNLPFIEVNADIIIDSHVGTSGQNIFKLFNQVNEPCVLFWDEIDSIGRRRGKGNDNAAAVENERMVNSILVNIEKLNNDVIFIGATNRREVLDSAFLRRFDVQYELPSPNIERKNAFANQMIEYYKIPTELISVNWDSMENYSEIKLSLIDIARKYILSKIESVIK